MANVQKREYSWVLILKAGIGTDGRRIKRSRTIKADGHEEASKKLDEFQAEFEASHPHMRIGTKILFRIDT